MTTPEQSRKPESQAVSPNLMQWAQRKLMERRLGSIARQGWNRNDTYRQDQKRAKVSYGVESFGMDLVVDDGPIFRLVGIADGSGSGIVFYNAELHEQDDDIQTKPRTFSTIPGSQNNLSFTEVMSNLADIRRLVVHGTTPDIAPQFPNIDGTM